MLIVMQNKTRLNSRRSRNSSAASFEVLRKVWRPGTPKTTPFRCAWETAALLLRTFCWEFGSLAPQTHIIPLHSRNRWIVAYEPWWEFDRLASPNPSHAMIDRFRVLTLNQLILHRCGFEYRSDHNVRQEKIFLLADGQMVSTIVCTLTCLARMEARKVISQMLKKRKKKNKTQSKGRPSICYSSDVQ